VKSCARLARDPALHAPHLVDLQVLSVLRRQATAGVLDARRAGFALQDLADLPITRYPHAPFARRVWELRSNLTPYDAAYVALAETLGCLLLTADARLARASGIHCDVEVLRTA
jgi:predicted nucleic acid-binding protein